MCSSDLEMMNKDQFIQNVTNWANDRKIIQNGTVEGQKLKFIEEAGELAAAIARNNIEGIKDAVGDMCVVDVILSSISSSDSMRMPLVWCEDVLGWKSNSTILVQMQYDYDVQGIATIAIRYNLTLEECWQAAWDAIKDRKGYMNEQGVFVKEEA